MTSKWLDRIGTRVVALTPEQLALEAKLPPVEPGDRVLGVVPEALRGLLALACVLDEEVQAKTQAHSDAHEQNTVEAHDCRAFHTEADALRRDINLLKQFFFASLREEPGFNEPNIAISESFQVVVPAPGLEDLFEILGGGRVGIEALLEREFAGAPRV